MLKLRRRVDGGLEWPTEASHSRNESGCGGSFFADVRMPLHAWPSSRSNRSATSHCGKPGSCRVITRTNLTRSDGTSERAAAGKRLVCEHSVTSAPSRPYGRTADGATCSGTISTRGGECHCGPTSSATRWKPTGRTTCRHGGRRAQEVRRTGRVLPGYGSHVNLAV